MTHPEISAGRIGKLSVPADLTGLVLCGGAGSRLGGIDKGLMPFHGKALVDIALEKITPFCGELLISANRNPRQYGERRARVVPDLRFSLEATHEGPLAGIQAALSTVDRPWLLVVPCDCPRFTQASIEKLIENSRQTGKASYLIGQPTFALLPSDTLASLHAFLGHGRRKLSDWLEEISAQGTEPFNRDELHSLNTPEDVRYQAPDS